MTHWGVRIARATGKPLHILWVESGSDACTRDLEWLDWSADLPQQDPRWTCVDEALSLTEEGQSFVDSDLSDGSAGETNSYPDSDHLEIQVCQVACRSRHQTVLAVERQLSPELIVVGRHDSAKDGSMTGKLARELLDAASSTVLVLRLGLLNGNESAEAINLSEQNESAKILVPCAGGRHSRRGMRLAALMAGRDATALYIESDADELSFEVGHEHLRRSLRRAGVVPEDVTCKVMLSEKISDAINDELGEGGYGLMLIGAAGGGTLRRKLFGTVPERLIQRDKGVSIGVIRAARPAGHRLRERIGRMMSLSIPQLQRDERIQLFAEIEGKARWSFDFAVLMILATAIAGLGLLADSGAVVIGAMLVAPLMTPLLGGGLAVVQANWPLWRDCQKSVCLGFFSALLIGLGLGFAARWMGLGLTGELLARGEPTLLDLCVAFVSGIAASYCLARPRLSGALAGVAIAAALVPPIATTGITLAMGEMAVAKGAALLFGANVVAIVLGSALNFMLAGVKGKQASAQLWAQRLAIMLALTCAGLSVPLASVLVSKASRVKPIEEMFQSQLDRQKPSYSLNQSLKFHVLNVRLMNDEDQGRHLEINLEGPGFPDEATVSMLHEIARERYGEGVKIRIRISLLREFS